MTKKLPKLKIQDSGVIRCTYSTKSEFTVSLILQILRRRMSSTLKSEEEISSYSSEVLEDAKKRIKEAYDILNRETNRVRKEPETVDEAAKRLENMHFSKRIKLDVGGHPFSTSLERIQVFLNYLCN